MPTNEKSTPLTDAEIKQALECCLTEAGCDACPYTKREMPCYWEQSLTRDALDLINRQQEMIDGLIAGQETLQKLLDDKCDRCIEKERAEAVKEIENEFYRIFAGHSDYHGDTVLTKITCLAEGKAVKCAKPINTNRIKSAAIKEFAERLKAKAEYHQNGEGWEGDIYYADDVDNIVKEMMGDAG